VVVVTAVLLLSLSIAGFYAQRGELAEIARGHLRLLVTGPARLEAGAVNHFSLCTSAVTGTPVSAQVEFAVYAADARRLLLEKKWTDAGGCLEVIVPADVNLRPGARLEISATQQNRTERLTAPLDVEPIAYTTRLFFDKPFYRPGQMLYYRSLTLSRFELAAAPDVPVQFEILDSRGAALAGSLTVGMTRQGVGMGSFRLPEKLAEGSYHLAVRCLKQVPDRAIADRREKFYVRAQRSAPTKRQIQAGGAARRTDAAPADGVRPSPPRSESAEHGRLEVAFYPEGGDLVAGLENRVYYAAHDARGRPVDLRGTIVDDHGNEIHDIETSYQGAGFFRFTPEEGGRYRLKITSPANVPYQPKLPENYSEHGVLLSAGPGVFEAGQPLTVTVLSVRPRLPLVVAAWCRGVTVGQQAIVTQVPDDATRPPLAGHACRNEVTLPLASDASGVIRVTVYDYRSTRPHPLAERLVYRRPGRRLQVRFDDLRPAYAPGEKVSLALAVSDERSQPVTAVLGVSAADAAMLGAAGDGGPGLPAELFSAEDGQRPLVLENAATVGAEDLPSPLALDLLLGTQGWRRFIEKPLDQAATGGGDARPTRGAVLGQIEPPAVFDNLNQIRAQYEDSLHRYRTQRTKALDTLTIVSFFGGFGLLLLVAMMALLNILTGILIWVPALGAAIGCLVIGAVLMNPDQLRPNLGGSVAFESFNLATAGAAPAASTPRETPAAPAAATSPPAAEKSPQRAATVLVRTRPVTAEAGRGEPPEPWWAGQSLTPQQAEWLAQSDFPKTLLWQPLLLTGRDGRARLEFKLPDAAATFRLRVDVHGDGRVGSAVVAIQSRRPPAPKSPPLHEDAADDQFMQ
jgi:hypothetical protein